MKEIILNHNKIALVDDEDYEYINQWKWYCDTKGYAVRSIKGKPQKRIYMHRLIMNTPNDMETDHINCIRLDNQKINLRVATAAQNQANRPMHRNNMSGRKGVTWYKNANKWCSRIIFHRKRIYIGLFSDLDEASQAYKEKAKELFGEFAYMN